METSFVTCVICPKGCSISVDWEFKDGVKTVVKVTGNSCPRGLKYATAEVIHPERVLTSTVRVKNGSLVLLPIRSATPIPKEAMMEAMKTISATVIDVADFGSCDASGTCGASNGILKMGTVVIKNIAGTGIDMIACRNVVAK
jgi:CxxC motif-containing protein